MRSTNLLIHSLTHKQVFWSLLQHPCFNLQLWLVWRAQGGDNWSPPWLHLFSHWHICLGPHGSWYHCSGLGGQQEPELERCPTLNCQVCPQCQPQSQRLVCQCPRQELLSLLWIWDHGRRMHGEAIYQTKMLYFLRSTLFFDHRWDWPRTGRAFLSRESVLWRLPTGSTWWFPVGKLELPPSRWLTSAVSSSWSMYRPTSHSVQRRGVMSKSASRHPLTQHLSSLPRGQKTTPGTGSTTGRSWP